MLEVREARYFIAVAEELNFGRAAQRLQMSQPPLSAAIKMMERRLGVILLHRTTREVQLTPAGAVFLDHCRALVAAAQAADIAAKRVADGQSGQLRVGAVTSAFTDPLPTSLEAFTISHPYVDVRVRELDTHVAVDLLRRRELDVALIRLLTAPTDCERVTVRREDFVLALPNAWHVPDGLQDNLFEAATLPWIWLPRSISPDYHDQVAACCRAAGFTPEAQHHANSITSQLAMVACGLGVALVPESAAGIHSPHKERINIVHLQTTSTIDLAAVWRRPSSALIDGFLQSIRSVVTA
jgi:DNA-binding transcriptional LysR family regulator